MLVDIIDKIAADFTARGVAVPIFFGPEYLAENASPPRVIFVPVANADRFGPAIKLGGSNPRTFGSVGVACDVHIWAQGQQPLDGSSQYRADYVALMDPTTGLVSEVARSFHRVYAGFDRIARAAGLNGTISVRCGLVYTVTIETTMPLVDVPWTNLTVRSTTMTVDQVRPDGSEQTAFSG